MILREREIELFEANRSYKELRERMNSERVDDIEFLPYDVVSTARGDNNVEDVYKRQQ